MNPFSQTRILLMYLILISKGWTWGRPLPSPNPLFSLPPLVSLLPRTYRARKFPLFPSLPIFPNIPPLPPPASLSIFSPSYPHVLSPLPFILSAPSLTLQSFWTWVSNWKCVYQQANSDGRKIVAHSGIEPETYIKQNPYALPNELFRPMRVTGFNLYLYIMTAFSSLRGCVIHIIISI